MRCKISVAKVVCAITSVAVLGQTGPCGITAPPPENTGACCVNGDTCLTDVTQTLCANQGGSWQGDGTGGCSNNCPGPTGACCVQSNACIRGVTHSNCANQAGAWQGADTIACANCPPPPPPPPVLTGACCIDNNNCVTGRTEITCNNSGGVWQGAGSSSCTGCDPTGACCVNGNECSTDVEQVVCTNQGGEWLGRGTTQCTNCPGPVQVVVVSDDPAPDSDGCLVLGSALLQPDQRPPQPGWGLVTGNGTHLYQIVDVDEVPGNEYKICTTQAHAAQVGVVGQFRFADNPNDKKIELRQLQVDANLQILDLEMPFNTSIDLTDNGSVTASVDGVFELDGEFHLAFDVGFGGLRTFSTYIGGYAHAEIGASIDAEVGASISRERPVTEPVKKYFSGLVGGFPVVVEVTAQVFLGIEGVVVANASAEVGVDADADVQVGARYDSALPVANRWSPIAASGFDWGYDEPTLCYEGSGSLRVYLRPHFEVQLYTLVGPTLDIEPYARLGGSVHGCLGDDESDYDVTLTAGAVGYAKIKADVLDLFVLESPRLTVFDVSEELASWRPPDCTSDTQCSDGNGCTTDTCSNGTCQNTPVSGCCTNNATLCNDNNACTTDTCTNGTCQNAPVSGCCTNNPSLCNDNNACTTDTCSNGFCLNTPQCTSNNHCNDGNLCTTDNCSNGCCQNNLINGCCTSDSWCDDGSFCNGTEICSQGQCRSGLSPCSSGETCNESQDRCQPTQFIDFFWSGSTTIPDGVDSVRLEWNPPGNIPANATITKVSVYHKITHTWVGDLYAEIGRRNSSSTWQVWVVRNREGGSADNIDETRIAEDYFDAQNPNTQWYYDVWDTDPVAEGTLKEVHIYVYYTSPP